MKGTYYFPDKEILEFSSSNPRLRMFSGPFQSQMRASLPGNAGKHRKFSVDY
jgi:hypothetical protein